jgi:hypothetical protein
MNIVRIVSPEGGIWHEGPITEEEEMELYRLAAYKPGATFLHGARPPVEEPPLPSAKPTPPEKE